MEGKKRYVAIVLFLLIGLTVFTFANPVEEQKGSKGNGSNGSEVTDKEDNTSDGTLGPVENQNQNQNLVQVPNQNQGIGQTEAADTSYDDALEAVVRAEATFDELDIENARDLIEEVTNQNQKDELTERVDIIEEAIETIGLVETLEKMVEDATKRDEIESSIDYRTDEEIIEKVDALRNEEVQQSLKDRLQILSRILDDNTAPKYEGVTDGETTNKDVSITYSDTDSETGTENEVTVTVTRDGEDTEFKDTFTEEGEYVVTLTDEAFNETIITFTIDKTAPKFVGIKNGNHYETIKVEVDDENATIVVKNMDKNETTEVANGTELTEDATYYITATDEAGNETSIWVAIDTNAPTITGVDETKPTNKNEIVYVKDKFLTSVTIDGKEYTRKDFEVGANNENFSFQKKVTHEGTHTVVATDKAGNTTTKTFVIDKTAAEVEVSKSNNDKSTNKDVTVTLKTNEKIVTPAGWTVVTEGTEFTKVYSENGKYTLTVKDLAGNETEVKFEVKRIDKVAPEATVTKSNNDKSTNQDVVVTLVANEAIYKPAGWTEVKTNKEHEFTKVYSENGKYEVVITDKAGNKSTIKFEVKRIDKVAPEGKVTTSNNNGQWSTNQDVVATLVTNEAIYKPEGWTEVKTNKEHEFTKVYSENGKYEVVITDKAGNKSTIKFEVKRIDKVAPVLTIVDPNRYQLEVHSTYVDKGYSAWDAVDKDVTKLIKITYQFQAKGSNNWESVDKLDTSKLGTYKLTYTAYDKAGNTAKGTRVVQIVDTTAPLLTLNGESRIVLEGGIDSYEELGATVTDNYDETITNLKPKYIHYRDKDNNLSKPTTVDTKKVGTYKIVYEHSDSSDNIGVDANRADHTYVMRTVIVQDTTAPVLTLNGDKNITLEAGIDTYKELGIKVTDNVDATIEALNPVMINFTAPDGTKETWLSEVDTTRVGQYKIQYAYEDASGNAGYDAADKRHAYIIRIVNVVDTTAPVVTVNGDNPVYVEYKVESYTELGATVTDNVDDTYVMDKPSYINHYTLDGAYIGRVDNVDSNKEGKYLLVYMATDTNKNESNNQLPQSKKWVIVSDRTAPVIEITKSEKKVYVRGTDIHEIKFNVYKDNNFDKPVLEVDSKTFAGGKFFSIDWLGNGEYTIKAIDERNNKSIATTVVDGVYHITNKDMLKNALKESGTYALSADIDLTDEPITISSGKDITLNLNGKTITGRSTNASASKLITINQGASLKLTGEGTIDFYAGKPDTNWGGEGQLPFPGYSSNTISNSGKLVIDGPTIINNTPRGGASYVIDNYPGADLTIESGLIYQVGGDQAIRTFANSGTNPINITVNGGEIKGYRAIWIHLPSESKDVAPIVNLTINGGKFVSTKENGQAIYTYSYGNAFNKVTAIFNGGEFVGDVQFGALQEGDERVGEETVIINDGTFHNFLGRWTNDGWKNITKPAK